MKRIIAIAVLSAALVVGLEAQASLTKSSVLPTVDGTIGADEYQYQGTLKGIKIAATLGSDDMLYLAIEAPSAGWAGLGVGGLVMNGSRLFLGAVQDGKGAFIEKAGVGHFYTDAKTLVVKKWAVKTSGSTTVMEISLPSSAAIWKGRINAILAYSLSPSFSSKHAVHDRITFTID
jgi:hypothetical protein